MWGFIDRRGASVIAPRYEGIPLEMCPDSNLQLSVVACMRLPGSTCAHRRCACSPRSPAF